MVSDPRLNDGRQSDRALAIRRGVGRLLSRWHFVWLPELTLSSNRRVDMIAVGPKSEIWIVEIKSSVQDMAADNKWPEYKAFCDRLYFATLPDVPRDIFPEDAGLIVADAHGGEFVRDVSDDKLQSTKRKAVMLNFARHAALQLQKLYDPHANEKGIN